MGIDRYIEKYTAEVQKEVPGEPVTSVAVLSRPGSWMGVGAIQVSGLAYAALQLSGRAAAGGLPTNMIAATTPTRVLFFKYKPRMTSIRLKGLVGEMSREGLTVTTKPGTVATRLYFTFPDGSAIELDANRSVGSYNEMNDSFIAELGGRPVGS